MVVLCSLVRNAASNDGQKRILIVYETESTLIAARSIAAGLLSEFGGNASVTPALYSEYLDLVRFPDANHRRGLSEFLAAKYRNIPLDLVLAVGPSSFRFMQEHQDAIAPGQPIVVGAISEETLGEAPGLGRLYGVVSQFDLKKTADLAAQLQPDASRIVVMTGSSTFDRRWEETARLVLGTKYGALDVSYLTGLSLAGFKDAAARLAPTAILLILTVYEDADGRKYVPVEAATEIVAASGAPAYAVYSSYIGRGVVGGHVETFDAMGMDMATLAKRILNGDMPTEHIFRTTAWPELDWRQLQRWAIDPALAPSDTRLKFYEPTIWEQYRWIILLVLMAIVAQSLAIVRLLYERRRRTAAEREVRSRVAELARINRVHVASELSASIAHEVNQPLSSIANHGSAAMRWLAASPANMKEAKTSLERVVGEALRVSRMIENIRGMLTKGVRKHASVQASEVVREAVDLVRVELDRRHVRLVTKVSRNMLPVSADRIQLQQVILNLVRNAADALEYMPASDRHIRILINTRRAKHVTITVADNGPGTGPDSMGKLFQPFFTTKEEGIGMGLAICRSIVQAHGGRLTASNRMPHGMAFRIILPAAHEGREG